MPPVEDLTVLRCAAELLTRLAVRVTNPPRLPSPGEARTLVWLRQSVSHPFEEATHEPLLRRLWAATFAAAETENEVGGQGFRRRSRCWCSLGFQQRDPASDVRGGGALCLEALCWLAERHPRILLHLLGARECRAAERGPYSSYPLACAGIAIVRRLCEFFNVVAPHTGRQNLQVEHTPASTWHLVQSRRHFMDLFISAFLYLDSAWDRSQASYMEFNTVFRSAMADFLGALERLPAGVCPSPLSFAPSTLLQALDADDDEEANIIEPPRQGIADLLTREEPEDNADATEEDQGLGGGSAHQSSWSLPPAPVMLIKDVTADVSVDLLGLDSLAEDLRLQEQEEKRKQLFLGSPTLGGGGDGCRSIGVVGGGGGEGVGFFESFGLE